MQNIKAPSLKTNKFFKHSCKKENNYLTLRPKVKATSNLMLILDAVSCHNMCTYKIKRNWTLRQNSSAPDKIVSTNKDTLKLANSFNFVARV